MSYFDPDGVPYPNFQYPSGSCRSGILEAEVGGKQIKQENALYSVGRPNPYIRLVAVLEQSLNEGSGVALTNPLRKQLQADREKRLSAGTLKVTVPKSLGIISPTPSAGSPTIETALSTAPSTTSIDVVVSSAMRTLRAQSPPAVLTGSPEVLSLQLDAVQGDPFVEEVRSTSTLSVVTAPSTRAAAPETTQSGEVDREPSEATIGLEAKETKGRGLHTKQRKTSGHSHHEKDEPTRRHDESDSDGEGNGESQKGHRRGSRKGKTSVKENVKENVFLYYCKGKHGSDRESTKSGRTRARSPKGQHSSAVAMAHKPPTFKSILRRAQLIITTVSERAVAQASPPAAMPTARSKAMPLSTTVRRVKSPILTVEKSAEKPRISKSANMHKHGQADYNRD